MPIKSRHALDVVREHGQRNIHQQVSQRSIVTAQVARKQFDRDVGQSFVDDLHATLIVARPTVGKSSRLTTVITT